nr:TnpV protein [Pelotomaculum sp. FP]
MTYSQSGDYLLPDVALPEAEQATIGKYGMLRHTYLKTHRRGLYAKLLLSGELYTHLAKVDLLTREMIQDIINQTIRKRNLPDKASRQMEWVGAMNELNHEAEESALYQIVYK